MVGLVKWFEGRITQWLIQESEPEAVLPSNFDHLSFEIRPCDVLLVEGRSRVSEVIKTITQSPWTHAALYLGRLSDIEDPTVREVVGQAYDGDPHDQIIIEALLGQGAIVSPLSSYARDHLRICRPFSLSRQDVQQVIAETAKHLGESYDVRQLFDLARFMLPWGILPRRWRSSLFECKVGHPTRTVCSSMIAAAFVSVRFPIMPVVHRTTDGKLRFYRRNTRLFIPRDFDYSPYFEIIKYPLLGLDDLAIYRQLPWDEDGVVCNTQDDCFEPPEQPPVLAVEGPEEVDPSPGISADAGPKTKQRVNWRGMIWSRFFG